MHASSEVHGATGGRLARDSPRRTFFDCALADTLDHGDHTLVVGTVRAVGSTDGAPLVYFDGDYRRLVLE